MTKSQHSDKRICLACVMSKFSKNNEIFGLNRFQRPTAIRSNSLQFCASVASSVFVLLFKVFVNILSYYLRVYFFAQFGEQFPVGHLANFGDTKVPLRSVRRFS